MDVSVIMPIYNSEDYLKDTLESLQAQEFDSFEVIIVDDGSTDRSSFIAKEFEKNDKRFKYFRKENEGAGAARNFGIERASGNFLVFLDSDDIFDSKLLLKLYAAVSSSDADVAVCSSDTFDSISGAYLRTLKPKYVMSDGLHFAAEFSEHLFQSFGGRPWDKIFSTEYIEHRELRFQNLRYSNDNYFVYCALAEASSVYLLDDVLVHYRVGHNESLRANTSKDPTCDLKSFDGIWSRLKEEGLLTGELLNSFRECCTAMVFSAAMQLKANSDSATRDFLDLYFDLYEERWGVSDLKYSNVHSKSTLWKYRQLRSMSFDGFCWACKRRSLSRATSNKRSIAKRLGFAVRLFIARVIHPRTKR